ncbi:MAG: hypothetical protein GY806_04585 [Gammaproteobacteria bacterium]|nr:hypothetical protein [Gammaproteobacteria bacterium]
MRNAEVTAGKDMADSPQTPSINLPRGGGAIRGLGEKFAANPVTGTGSMTLPIATSSGRSGFGPQLSLSYDSGAGNGPFGFGWNMSLPAISRKTDKGLPRYGDSEIPDSFILSGAEDLVPIPVSPAQEGRHEGLPPSRRVDNKNYLIRYYRPRIEGLFARIECWVQEDEPVDTFWRSISRDNITSWYGKTCASRIHDPSDHSRIFSWLICESHDDKGNAVVYQYKPEDSASIEVSAAHEVNRNPQSRSSNRYLKRIFYANTVPYYPELSADQPWPSAPAGALVPDENPWLFEVVFDYGEHDVMQPLPNDSAEWGCRPDPFSSYRAGFELRTYRLCQRVLMFHHFPDEEIGANCLVLSTDFGYAYEQDPGHPRSAIYTFLGKVSQTGYKKMQNFACRCL